jgi:hypothetical protein
MVAASLRDGPIPIKPYGRAMVQLHPRAPFAHFARILGNPFASTLGWMVPHQQNPTVVFNAGACSRNGSWLNGDFGSVS